jgi:hypothetical protein
VLWHVTVMPFSIIACTDLFFAFLFTFSIYVLFRGSEITKSNLMLAGLLMGLTYLTRHNGVILPVAVVLIVLLLEPQSWSLKQKVVNLVLFAIVFVAINLPWNLVQYFASGEPVRSDSYLIIASHFYGSPGVVVSEDMRLAAKTFDSLSSVIFYDFTHFIKHYIFNFYRHFYDVLIDSLKFPTFIFTGAGLVLLLPRLNRKQFAFFIFLILSFLLLCLVHYEPRYYLYLLFFFLLPAVYFLFEGVSANSGSDNRLNGKVVRSVIYTGTVLFILVFSVKEIRSNIRSEPRELLGLAETLRDQISDGESIIARKPHIGFLTGLQTIYFPEAESQEELLAFAAKENADYLIYGAEELKRRPQLRNLLDPGQAPAGMIPVAINEYPKTVIYKFQNLKVYD